MFSLFLLKAASASDDCYKQFEEADCNAVSQCNWAINTVGNSQHVFVKEMFCLSKNFTLPEQKEDTCTVLKSMSECTSNSACMYSSLEDGIQSTFQCSEYTKQERPCSASGESECAQLEQCSWYNILSKRSEESVCLSAEPIVPPRHRGLCQRFDNDKLGCNAEKMCDFVEFFTKNSEGEVMENVRFCNAEATRYVRPSFDDGGVCEVNYDAKTCDKVGACMWVKAETAIGAWSWCAAKAPEEPQFNGLSNVNMLVFLLLFAFVCGILLCICLYMCVVVTNMKKQSDLASLKMKAGETMLVMEEKRALKKHAEENAEEQSPDDKKSPKEKRTKEKKEKKSHHEKSTHESSMREKKIRTGIE